MGDEVTFYCMVSGIPPPSITWYRNGTVLNDTRVVINDPSDSTTILNDDGEIITYYVNRTLTLRMSEDRDSGSYECSASNEATPATGDDSMAFELIVQSRFKMYTLYYYNYDNYSSL